MTSKALANRALTTFGTEFTFSGPGVETVKIKTNFMGQSEVTKGGKRLIFTSSICEAVETLEAATGTPAETLCKVNA